MKQMAVFASHGGSNLQAIIDGCNQGKIDAKVSVVISNNPDAYALRRAENAGIPGFCLNKKLCGISLGDEMLKLLAKYNVDMVFLAGYLKKLPGKILQEYCGCIYNIHPALLPKYGGKGMYGMNVHKAVLDAGEKISGATIHRVEAEYDIGEIISQKKVPVLEDDTPETLAKRVLAAEHELIVETLTCLCERSEAIHTSSDYNFNWIASSAMLCSWQASAPRNDEIAEIV